MKMQPLPVFTSAFIFSLLALFIPPDTWSVMARDQRSTHSTSLAIGETHTNADTAPSLADAALVGSTITTTIVSDTNAEYYSGTGWVPAVLAWTYSGWPTLRSASWIWKSYHVTPDEALNGTSIITFRRRFELPLDAQNITGIIQITADNAYELSLNGAIIGQDGVLDVSGADYGWQTVETYQLNARPGGNEIEIRAINYRCPIGSSDPIDNPAGLLFRADISAVVGPTPFTLRIVSDSSWRVSGTLVSGWKTVDFDDSGWGFTVAPAPVNCGFPTCYFIDKPDISTMWSATQYQTIYLRKSFFIESSSAVLSATIETRCDDDHDVYINGTLVASDWDGVAGPLLKTDIKAHLQKGKNVIAIKASDTAGVCRHLCVDANIVLQKPTPFLDLPFSYSPHTLDVFTKLATYPTTKSGRLNSWFDHNLPNYETNNQLQYWNGFTVTQHISGDICLQYGTCYDGHNGVDFQTSGGLTITAAYSGTILNTITNTLKTDCPEWQNKTCGNRYGNQVWIDHHNGYATLYGHLKIGTISVSPGQNVTAGQVIAITGNSGNTGGGHVHFGLYYDANGDGSWTGEWTPSKPNEVVDPYGWKSNLTDPWVTAGGPTSYYVWLYPVGEPVAYLPTSGVTFTLPSGTITGNIPPNAYPSSLTLDLSEGPVAAPSAQLRITGHSFTINATPSGGFAPSRVRRPTASSSITLTLPATLTVSYTASDITHLSESNLGIYRWDENANVWNLLTSNVETTNKQVTAQTDQFGAFALFAPSLCPADIYEPNDDYRTANFTTTDGQSQSQLFDIASDQDWIKFNAVAGTTYVIRTSNLSASTDTVITLYDRDGLTPIATDDNSGGGKASRLMWRAPATGTYFVKTQNANPSVSGCSVTYGVSIRGIPPIFLPLIMR